LTRNLLPVIPDEEAWDHVFISSFQNLSMSQSQSKDAEPEFRLNIRPTIPYRPLANNVIVYE
jgi:hypothetical protein